MKMKNRNWFLVDDLKLDPDMYVWVANVKTSEHYWNPRDIPSMKKRWSTMNIFNERPTKLKEVRHYLENHANNHAKARIWFICERFVDTCPKFSIALEQYDN